MAFDFPSSPITGQSYTAGGVSYVWNGYAWTGGPVADLGLYVAKAGDTMTGNLTIKPTATSPDFILDRPAVANPATIKGAVNGAARWRFMLGNTTAESGGNAGSDFAISRYNDAGVVIDEPFSINRATGLVTSNLAQPSGLAHRSGAGAVALGTAAWTKVNMGTLGVNIGGFTIAGQNLNIPKNGIYLVGGSLDIQMPTSIGSLLVGVCLNGLVPFMQARNTNSAANNYRYVMNVSRLVGLSAGDALTLAGFCSVAGATVGDTNDSTFMWATLVAAQ